MSYKYIPVLLLFSFLSYGQEDVATVKNDSLVKESSFRFHFDIGYLAGFNASGDNFVAQGFDINPGADFAASIQYNQVSFHLDVQVYSGTVTDQELVGAITRSSINRTSIGIGYYFDIAPNISINPSINYGSITYRSTIPDSADFRDEGNTISLDLKGFYEISHTFSVFASLSYFRDRLDIETAPSQQDFFRNVTHFNPSIGLRFSTRSVRRKPGEAGDGIFTRRDGL